MPPYMVFHRHRSTSYSVFKTLRHELSQEPRTGLSLSSEAGVTLKISPLTCNHLRPEGPEPQGGLGACSSRKFLKLEPRKSIFQHSKEQIVYFLNQKVMKIKQGKKINFTMNRHLLTMWKWSCTTEP